MKDLKEFNFPKLTGADLAFSTLRTDKDLLELAKEKGFYCRETKYNKLFSQLFFNGGKLDLRNDIDEDFKNNALIYFKALISSWMPKHEEKEAICSLILSEIHK